ncbi:MAG: hypothetical protein HY056_02485, partial [Proteobacteria bacterium]|nr:hypothetical protein [Pseudomonadota bacterium]
MKKLVFCLAVAVLFGAAPATAQKIETIRLTIGSSHPPVIPWVMAMKNTVVAKTNKALEAKNSKYRIEWNEAYGGVLYNFENTLEAIEQGITDFGWVGTLWEPAKMPLQNIMFATPFTNNDPDVAVKVMQGMMDKNASFKKEWETQNAVYFAATTSDSYQLFTKFPVKSLEDLKGRRIGLVKEFQEQGQPDPEVSATFTANLKTLQDLGAQVVDVSLPSLSYAIAV